MDLRPPAPMSDEDRYWLAQRGRLASTSPSVSRPADEGDQKGGDAATVPARSGVKVETIVADRVVIGAAGLGATGTDSTTEAQPSLAQSGTTLPENTAESVAAAAPSSPEVSSAASAPSTGSNRTPRGSKLRPRRRRRVRLRYLIASLGGLVSGPRGDLVGLGRCDLRIDGCDQEDPQLRLGAGLLQQRRARVAADLR